MINRDDTKYLVPIGIGTLGFVGLLSGLGRWVLPTWVAMGIALPPFTAFMFFDPQTFRERTVRVARDVASGWYVVTTAGLLVCLAMASNSPSGWPVYVVFMLVGLVPCIVVVCHEGPTGRQRIQVEQTAVVRKPLEPPPSVAVPLTRSTFVRLAAAGVRHAFRLRSGESFLGWVEEVVEDQVRVEWALSPFDNPTADQPTGWVRFADIDPASLAYWDSEAEQWVDLPTPDPSSFAESWRSETVVALAVGIRADEAFDRLPVLADALEEAGCDDRDILDHCRGGGPHTCGSWVVDLVLDRR